MNQKIIKRDHTSHIPLHTSNKGITLVALVITIIVLLILAGVTISMVLGDDGIIQNAQTAKQATKDAAIQEEINKISMEKGMKEHGLSKPETLPTNAEDVIDRLETKGIVDDNELVADGETLKYRDGRTTTFSLAGILGSVSEEPKELLANIVEVGDYVEYNYTAGTYQITAEDSGLQEYAEYENDSSLAVTQKYDSSLSADDTATDTKAAKVTNWRVLSNEGGVIKLVAEEPISSTLTLAAANGYLNGPTVLDAMCSALYQNANAATKVESIDVDDVNKITGYDGTEYYYSELEGETFVKGGTSNGSGYYEYDASENLMTNTASVEYELLFGSGDSLDPYWLASYCYTYYEFVAYERDNWGLRYVDTGKISCYDLNEMDNDFWAEDFCVRPVVTLKNGLEKIGGDGSSNAPYEFE